MNIGTIVQENMTLIPFLGDLPAQWSGNFEVGVTTDSQYDSYTPYLSIGYMTDNIGQAALVAIEDGVATIPPVAFEHSGLIMISVVLINGEEQLVTKPLTLKVEHAPLLGAETTPSQTGIIAAVEAVVDAKIQSVGGLSEAVKQALLDCFANVAWINDQGQTYYDALEAALYPPVNLVSISAVYNGGTVYNTATLDDLKTDLVVTALYDDMHTEVVTNYTLFGTIATGPQTISVSYGGKATSFDIVVVEWLVSISAVYSGGDVPEGTALNDLKADLTVTATYADSTTGTVSAEDYVLSGTIEAGTQTITVTYGNKTTTFTVTVTQEQWSGDDAWYDGKEYRNLTVVANEYVKSNNGTFVAYNGWSRTGFVYCEGASTITFPACNDGSGGSSDINENGWYSTNDVSGYISKITIGKWQERTVTVPANAKYFAISCTDQGLADCIAAGIVPHA